MKSDSIVIIPTYNEKENIRAITEAVLEIAEHQFDVLVIDDGSPDGTAAIVRELIGAHPERVHLVEMRDQLAPDANVRHRPLLLQRLLNALR